MKEKQIWSKGVFHEYASPSLLNREFANQEALNIDLEYLTRN